MILNAAAGNDKRLAPNRYTEIFPTYCSVNHALYEQKAVSNAHSLYTTLTTSAIFYIFSIPNLYTAVLIERVTRFTAR